MIMLRKISIVILVLLVTLAFVPACKPQATGNSTLYGYAVGNKAIDFTLNDLSGNPVTLSSYLGKPVLLNFWDTA
jgi:cytochrome oxidase Cu insertion factor (SCO1/SenC/PrrC family)